MACSCGCGPRRRTLAGVRSSRFHRARSLGDLTANDLANGNYGAALTSAASGTAAGAFVFDASKIAGQAMTDVNTATGVLNAYTDSGVDLTGAEGKAQTQKVATAIMLIPGVGTVIGGAILAITSAVGYAHAGAGICASEPPTGPGLGDLKRWPHYQSWRDSVANAAPNGLGWFEGRDRAGSFEDVANRALAYNRALQDNCFSNLSPAAPLVLAQVVAAWNATHLGPTRTITRRMTDGRIGSTAVGYDPIADALETAGGSDVSGKTVSLTIKDGPHVAKIVTLRLHPRARPDAATHAASAPSSPSSKAAAVAVLALAGAGLFYVHTQTRRGRPLVPRALTRLAGGR